MSAADDHGENEELRAYARTVAAHTYLGIGEAEAEVAPLDQVVFAAGARISLPFFIGHIVLPGDEVPVFIAPSSTLAQQLQRGHRCVVWIPAMDVAAGATVTLARVTAVGDGPGRTVAAKLQGTQRAHFCAHRESRVVVEVIGDDPGSSQRLPDLGFLRVHASAAPGSPAAFACSQLCAPTERLVSMLHFPTWVLRGLDCRDLSARALSLCRAGMSHGAILSAAAVADDPNMLSYHLARNALLSDAEQWALLQEPSAGKRLSYLVRHLRQSTGLRCANTSCNSLLATTDQLFEMSAHGAVTAFVNPYGIIHDTATVRGASIENIALNAEESTEHSWFPGYAWSIASCVCGEHLGWAFVSTSAAWRWSDVAVFRRTILRMMNLRPSLGLGLLPGWASALARSVRAVVVADDAADVAVGHGSGDGAAQRGLLPAERVAVCCVDLILGCATGRMLLRPLWSRQRAAVAVEAATSSGGGWEAARSSAGTSESSGGAGADAGTDGAGSPAATAADEWRSAAVDTWRGLAGINRQLPAGPRAVLVWTHAYYHALQAAHALIVGVATQESADSGTSCSPMWRQLLRWAQRMAGERLVDDEGAEACENVDDSYSEATAAVEGTRGGALGGRGDVDDAGGGAGVEAEAGAGEGAGEGARVVASRTSGEVAAVAEEEEVQVQWHRRPAAFWGFSRHSLRTLLGRGEDHIRPGGASYVRHVLESVAQRLSQ